MLTDTANHSANNVKGPIGFSLEQERDGEDDDQRRVSYLPTRGTDSWRSPFKEEELAKPRTQAHPPRLPPQQHLASLAGRGLLEGEHLEVMPISSCVLRVDIGAGEGI